MKGSSPCMFMMNSLLCRGSLWTRSVPDSQRGLVMHGAGADGKRELQHLLVLGGYDDLAEPRPDRRFPAPLHHGFPAIARAPCRETLRPVAGRNDYQAVLDADY